MQFKKSLYLLLLLVLILTISLIIFYLLNNKQKNNIENFGTWNFYETRKLSKDTINRDVEDKYYKRYNHQKKVTDTNARIKMLDMLKKEQRQRELNQLKLNKLEEANTYNLRNQIYKDYSPSKYGYGTIKKTNNSLGSLRGLFGDWLFSG